MAAIVANKVKRLRNSREAKTASELSGLETPQLYHRNGAANRTKQISHEEFLQQQQKIRYYQQVNQQVKLKSSFLLNLIQKVFLNSE
jgi:hypothetical protein